MVYATVRQTDLLSGHADHKDLVKTIKQTGKPKRVFLVHGETSSLNALAASLEEENFDVIIPKRGECFDLA